MLSKINRVKGTAKFNDIFKKGEKLFSSFFVVYKLRFNESREPLIGFIASKKVGGAVERNRAKRMLSEAVRIMIKEKKSTYDYLFIAKKEVIEGSLVDIVKEVSKIWL